MCGLCIEISIYLIYLNTRVTSQVPESEKKSYLGYSYNYEGSEIWMISETAVLFVKISVSSHEW